MRKKITNIEMLALIALYAELVRKYKLMYHDGEEVENLLYLAIFETTYIKLQRKAFFRKRKYMLNLAPQEAIAFWLEFNGIMDETTQAGNFIQSLCNRIHQQILINVA